MFRNAERTFTIAECTFTIAEHTFATAEYKTNTYNHLITLGCIAFPFTLSFHIHDRSREWE